MEALIMGVIAFAIAIVVRRKEAFAFRWQPTRHTWVAIGTGLLAFVFSASILLVGTDTVAARVIHNGLIYVLCGFAIPWGYTLLVEHNPPAEMGLKRERWALSLVLSIVLAALFSPLLIFEGNLGAVGWAKTAKAAFVLTGAGGLFELFLYYGFIHLRLEKAFGVIPTILTSSLLYVSWHTGTQLPLEPDPVLAAVKLFGVGVMYQSVFSLTRNLLIVWPFFHLSGVMIDFAVNIGAVERISDNLPWAIGTVLSMAVIGVLLALLKPSDLPINR